jgi:hypothetical protein
MEEDNKKFTSDKLIGKESKPKKEAKHSHIKSKST